jgi:hypothetical protein
MGVLQWLENMGAHGMPEHVKLLQRVGIWKF